MARKTRCQRANMLLIACLLAMLTFMLPWTPVTVAPIDPTAAEKFAQDSKSMCITEGLKHLPPANPSPSPTFLTHLKSRPLTWKVKLWSLLTKTPLIHLTPRKNCTDVFRVRQPLRSYKNPKTGARLIPSDVVVYVLLSTATIDRYISGPFLKWKELQGSVNVILFIPQASDRVPEAVSLNVKERTDNKISDFSILALQKAHDMYPSKKWFLKFDDDAYLFVPNLLTILALLDPSQHIMGGRVFFENNSGISGGAGYFMSNSVIKAVARGAGVCYTLGNPQGEDEDLLIQRCAKKQFGPKALQIFSICGMYAYNVKNTKDNLWAGSPERLIDYPITFHWIRTANETAAIHECRLSDY